MIVMNNIYITIYTRDAKLEYTKDDYYKLFFGADHYLDRKDGPALEWFDGSKHWYVDGRLHRLDGPAIENVDHNLRDSFNRRWYIDGVQWNRRDYRDLIREVKDMPLVLRLVDPRKWVRDFNLKTI